MNIKFIGLKRTIITKMKRIAIVGTMGVPAKYGGFETLVENIIGENANPEIEYTIFCSSKSYKEYPKKYKGANLRFIGLKANGAQSTPYDIVSLIKCWFGKFDCVVILGVSGCIFLPIFRMFYRKNLVINIDGLEHKRDKWGKFARKFLLLSEKMAVKYANYVISDNKGIQDYVTATYNRPSVLIAYGGDHVLRKVSSEKQQEILKKYNLDSDDYAFTVCRIEPENNCHHTLEAFAQSGNKLMFVGNFEHSEYARGLKTKYEKYPNIIIQNAIYDLDILYTLRNNCKWYIHGHSAGGTNPSLVEAMHFGRNILAFNVVYNRETTQGKAYYWNNVDELKALLEDVNLNCGKDMKEIAMKEYVWKCIAEQYESLY